MKLLYTLRLGIKLPLMLVSISLVALLVMGVMSYRLAADSLLRDGKARLTQEQTDHVSMIENWSKSALDGVTVAPTYVGIRTAFAGLVNPAPGLSPEDLRKRYASGLTTLAHRENLYDLMLVNDRGEIVFSTVSKPPSETASAAIARVVREASEPGRTEPAVSEIVSGVDGDIPVIYLAMPIRQDDLVPSRGVLIYANSLRPIFNEMNDTRSLGVTGKVYVIDAARHVILGNAERVTSGPAERITSALSGSRSTSIGLGSDGIRVVSASGPAEVFGHRYAVLVEEALGEISAPAHRLALNMMLAGLAIMVLLTLISWLMARSVSRPLAGVADAIHNISERRLNEGNIVGTDRGDEVGLIARALEGLRGELIRAEKTQLEATVQGTAFRTSSAAMMMIDADFTITYVNTAMIRLINDRIDDFRAVSPTIVPETLVGKTMDLFHRNPEHARRILNDPTRLPYHAELTIGAGRFALDVNSIEIAEKGQIGFVVEWRDVTELRMNRALMQAMGDTQLILETTPDGTLCKANENLVRALGFNESQLIGRKLVDIVAGTGEQQGYWDRLKRFEAVSGTFRLAGHGRTVIAEGSITAVPDQKNELMRIVMIANDVTVAETALSAERERSERLAKDQDMVVDALRIGLTALSTGDLTVQIREAFPAQYEQLRADFNGAVGTLASAMQVVIDNAAAIDNEAREINSAAQDLSARTEKQAATLEETAAALDQLTVSVSSASNGVMDANRVVKLARESAESSGGIVQQAVAAMGEIEESSRKISRIIGVIDDIAFQTNLLALNAGVEAARAGGAGRGFAGVASEVRALAQRSSEAAREIDGLITTSSGHVRRGVDLVGETGIALEKILSSVNDIASRVSEIAASAHEQAAGLSEINIAVNQLDQVTQHNSAMFDQTTAASQALTQGAQELAAAAARFRTSDMDRPSAAAPASSRVVTPMPKRVQQSGNTLKAVAAEDEGWEGF